MARILVGLSGGVDSAVAAYLLRQSGHDVIGITLRTWESGPSRCCRIDAARETARFLGIPYHVIRCVSDFQRKVEAPFVESYLQGITPNPCILCNPEVKWAWMLYAAELFQAKSVATGHYASLVQTPGGRFAVQQAADAAKDQSYMLYRLSQEQLAKTLFPLGELKKEEVRRIALRAGLPSAGEADSQDICFVDRGGYADFVRAHAPDGFPDSGNFVDTQGRILGRHRGIARYTVGQRRGLGLALGWPAYVKSIRPATHEVVIAAEEELWQREILCGDVCFSGISGLAEGQRIRGTVKTRYRHPGAPVWIEGRSRDTVRVCFDEPVWAPAPGQSAVFYDPNRYILGGGLILPDDR